MSKEKTVTIGCKLPNGLVLEVGGKSVQINGANSSQVIGGHGITHNVDADLWQAWLKQNADRAVVKNGFVFAHDKAANAKAEAKEKTDTKTGQEPIDPNAKNNGVETVKE